MKKDLLIKSRGSLQKKEANKLLMSGSLADFNLPLLSADRLETERTGFLKILCDSIIDLNVIQQIANSKILVAEIPPQLKNLYKDGKLHFDESRQIFGNKTPNLRDGDGNLLGQATLKEQCNPADITNALANLALYSAIQQIASEVAEIHEEVKAIAQVQKTDHYAKITSAYYTYEYLLHDGKERESSISNTLLLVENGLHEIHQSFEPLFKKLSKAPHSNWNLFWYGFKHPIDVISGKLVSTKIADSCNLFIAELFMYYQFILLTDVLMNDMNRPLHHDLVNHEPFVNLYQRMWHDDAFYEVMNYSIGNTQITSIPSKLIEFNDGFKKQLLENHLDAIKIELSQKDVETLKLGKHE